MASLILFNKPFQVLSQFRDREGRKTLGDYLCSPDFYPAGRLDYDSEGLLLLTDNGRLQQRISDPRFKLWKTYLVQVEGRPTAEDLSALREGRRASRWPQSPGPGARRVRPGLAVAPRPADPATCTAPHGLAGDRHSRGAQSPGPAHDRGPGAAHAATDPLCHRRLDGAWTGSR